MRCTKNVGSSCVNRRVYHECGGIEKTVRTAVDDLAVVVDLDQV
jgi:hypothetical protein